MKNSIVIKKNDYERYKIPVSIVSLFPKAYKTFLWDELEKRHPCFSEKFCYSAKNHFSSHGVFSDVVVMEKTKLAEYKNQLSFPKKLVIDGPKKTRVFENTKIKILFFVFIFITFLIIGFIYNSQKVNKKIETINNENDFMEKNQQVMDTYNSLNKKALENLFNIVKNNKGTIESFNWSLKYTGEKIICSLNNIYPEYLENTFNDINIPVIKYKDKTPVFAFNYMDNYFLPEKKIINENISINSKKIVREFLQNKNCRILEETIIPYGIVFEGSITKLSKENIISELGNLLSKHNLYLTSIDIVPLESNSKSQKFHFYLTFSEEKFYKNKVLNLIGENFHILFTKASIKINPVIDKSNYVLRDTKLKINPETFINEDIKVGEIVYKSGKKVVFYKNNEGKINKKEFYNAN